MSDEQIHENTDTDTPKPDNVVRVAFLNARNLDWLECIQLYQSGWAGDALAAHFHVNRKTIYNGLKRYGIVRQKGDEAKERAKDMIGTSGITQKQLLNAIQEAGYDEDLGKEDAIVENQATKMAKVQIRHQKVLAMGVEAVKVLLTRLAKSEYSETVKTAKGATLLVSASAEVKNCTAALKVLVPLERIAHGIDSPDGEEKARKAAEKEAGANGLVKGVLEQMEAARKQALKKAG